MEVPCFATAYSRLLSERQGCPFFLALMQVAIAMIRWVCPFGLTITTGRLTYMLRRFVRAIASFSASCEEGGEMSRLSISATRRNAQEERPDTRQGNKPAKEPVGFVGMTHGHLDRVLEFMWVFAILTSASPTGFVANS